MSNGSIRKPKIVVAADWSKDGSKRWMVRAEYNDSSGQYLVYAPEPVGCTETLLERLQSQAGADGTVLIGFDFPIGLPVKHAQAVGITSFRDALRDFGRNKWHYVYDISDTPTLHAPFFPLPKRAGEKGNYKQQLIERLGFGHIDDLLRVCDRKSGTRNAAECLFFTLGGKQVGPSVIDGWKHVLAPALDRIRLWPFDGGLTQLLRQGGITVAKIYPAESYRHLGIHIGSSTGRSKANRQHRLHAEVCPQLYQAAADHPIRFTDSARSWIDFGFQNEDQFDAMAGLLSMLKVVLGEISEGAPDSSAVRNIEGWILGQASS